MASAYRERTDAKLRYAKIHLEELRTYSNAYSNDDWENAHQESTFFHLTGAVEGILHEINDGYSLGLNPRDVERGKVRDRLKKRNQSSPAFDYITGLRPFGKEELAPKSWLTLLFAWRNYSGHQKHIGKCLSFGTSERLRHTDNQFKDPMDEQLQQAYSGLGCQAVLERLTNDVENLINHCRSIDPQL
jgi:hypothetical protein